MLDVVLQVAHEHEVAGLVPAGVQCMVVDVAEDCAGPDAVSAVLSIDELAEAVHDDRTVFTLALLLVLLRLQKARVVGQKAVKDNSILICKIGGIEIAFISDPHPVPSV